MAFTYPTPVDGSIMPRCFCNSLIGMKTNMLSYSSILLS